MAEMWPFAGSTILCAVTQGQAAEMAAIPQAQIPWFIRLTSSINF
jgi:hypothetical protein